MPIKVQSRIPAGERNGCMTNSLGHLHRIPTPPACGGHHSGAGELSCQKQIRRQIHTAAENSNCHNSHEKKSPAIRHPGLFPPAASGTIHGHLQREQMSKFAFHEPKEPEALAENGDTNAVNPQSQNPLRSPEAQIGRQERQCKTYSNSLIIKDWGRWRESESNRRHADFQSAALPTELSRHILTAYFWQK